MNFESIALIFPHQLFKNHPALSEVRSVCMVEEMLFFRQFAFHRLKIVFHRASMQYFKEMLQNNGFDVYYQDASSSACNIEQLIESLFKQGCKEVHVAEVVDNWLEKRLKKACQLHNIAIVWYESPGFLNSKTENKTFQGNSTRFFQAKFYKNQRIAKNILLEKDQQPVGGQWSFDEENRKKIPKQEPLPSSVSIKPNKWLQEAFDYAYTQFSFPTAQQPKGLFATDFPYPITHDDAEAWLEHFLEHKFQKFGVYEDAMVAGQPFLFHSVLAPLLNVGLLTPQQVLNALLQNASSNAVPINSVEGFVRQIIGWREFVRMVYESNGVKQRTSNFFQFTRKIPASFYEGTTGIDPLDEVIGRLNQFAYVHHIERLMVLGNFMLLCEFHPDEVYRWFMELFIDSYDWVMVPNVYGMSQFADGGSMTTKPYICGSNYILKMSNFKKGPWCETWDALFWRFLMVHRQVFEKNPRWKMLLSTLDKMGQTQKDHYLLKAQVFLDALD